MCVKAKNGFATHLVELLPLTTVHQWIYMLQFEHAFHILLIVHELIASTIKPTWKYISP